MEAILKASKLGKKFGSVNALRDVTFEVIRQDVLGVIGPNGAGKTTFFNVISGFLKADAGSVIFDDIEVTHMKSFHRVRCGMSRTFQIPKPFTGFSLFDNLMITYCPSGEKNRSEAIGKILDLMGLGDKREELAANLPIGLLKRLEVARALSTSPSLLLLDEPFAGLNSLEIEQLSNAIVKLNSEQKITIVIIEHKLRELMRLVNRIVVLNYGEVIAQGSPAEIAYDPRVLKAYIGDRTAKRLQQKQPN